MATSRLVAILSSLAIAGFVMSAKYLIASKGASDELGLAPQSELAAYRAAPTRCVGVHADQAAEVAFTRFHAWRAANNQKKPPPAGAFADAEQALQYLYDKLGCRDGLIAYRHGNVLRLRMNHARAIEVIDAALPEITAHYRPHLRHALFTLAQASVSNGKSETAIAYYQRVVAEDPWDANARLNLANQLVRQSRFEEARIHIEAAQGSRLSEYGQSVAARLLEKLPQAE